ncbi:J domain-containing protein [Deinococcus fonticola]|uniref:J domain-containing protein n=1 Tax=Deinococcus fonticola TaxID=2528713 RepID=UPI001074B958|nr:J domain-containing protein [Deinococcus fonticola]
MNYFQNITDAAELKNLYRQLCKTHHPDKGGSTEQMQDINNQYEAAMKRLISGKSETEYGEGKWYKTRDEEEAVEKAVQEAIQKIAHLDGLDIEIIGAWVWVSGDTKNHKDTLKDAGYWWMHNRKMWAFKGKESKGRGKTSMEELRDKYGSEKVYTRSRTLTAN